LRALTAPPPDTTVATESDEQETPPD